MNTEDKEPTETQSDIDLEAAQAEISSELFGQGDEGEKVERKEINGTKLARGQDAAKR